MIIANIRKKVIVFFVAVAMVFSFSWPLTAQHANCMSHSELVETPESELALAKPCDHVGAAYLLGFNVIVDDYSFFSQSTILTEYVYYIYFRLYLAVKANPLFYSEDDAYAYLMLGAALRSEPDLTENPTPLRGNYYATFAMAEYWDGHSDTIEVSEHGLRTTMLSLMRNSEFANNTHLRCFIRHDIPTLPIEEIMNSSRYRLCLGGS